jgi:hypothetical protein
VILGSVGSPDWDEANFGRIKFSEVRLREYGYSRLYEP